MNEQQALQILVNTALKAQASGALTLDEAVIVRDAINTFKKEPEKVEKETEPYEKSPD